MMRSHVLPLQVLWEAFLGRPVLARVFEDNAAVVTVVQSGFSVALRHLVKHQRISLGLIHDCIQDDRHCVVQHIATKQQKGDIFTKKMLRQAFEHCLQQIGICKGTDG